MSTRKRIEEFKQKLKLAGMIATMGTMTLSSCTPNTNSKDSDKDKIETVEKTKSQYDNPYQKALYEGTFDDVAELIDRRETFDKEVYFDAIKLSKSQELALLFNSGLRQEVKPVLDSIKNYNGKSVDSVFTLIDTGFENTNGKLDMDSMLQTAITCLKNREKDMNENKPDSQEKWEEAKKIVYDISYDYCLIKNPEFHSSPKRVEFHSNCIKFRNDVIRKIKKLSYTEYMEAYFEENSSKNIVTRYKNFTNIYSNAFNTNEKTTESFKYIKTVCSEIEDNINERKTYERSPKFHRGENAIYDTLHQNVLVDDFNKIKYTLENGGRQYINSSYHAGSNLLELPIVSLCNAERYKDEINYNDNNDIQNRKKIINLLIQNGADINLVSPEVLKSVKNDYPETYKFVMETVQKNNMIKNKTSERGR